MTRIAKNLYPLLRCYWLFAPLFLGLLAHTTSAADQKYWELSPYRIKLHVAVDDSQRPQPKLATQLTQALQQQIRATLYPLWSTEIQLVEGPQKQQQLLQLRQWSDPLNEKSLLGCDKQLFLNVVSSALGTVLESREFDCSTLRWGAVQRRQVRQEILLPSQCFAILCETFSPLATIRPIPDSSTEILLRFRGSELPQQTDLSFLTPPGEAYQPLMVRTNSSGEVKTDSIREIPWTYLTLDQKKEDGWHGQVHTGTRRPFGVRRRARVEHLALALRNPVGPTRVRFYARHDSTQGLSGYEIFRREPQATESQPLGLTDTTGAVEILASESKVSLLFLRSEGQLLAKVPIVPGAKRLIEVPIADDTARLRAQASLTSLTEQLIDTVAQRNILMARVRDRLQNGQIDQAQELFTTLDSLPGRAQFDQKISSAENRKLNQSTDPKVQSRIESLFANTRKLLGRFLSTKQISKLQGELNAARRGKAS